MTIRVAFLDDYQGAVGALAPLDRLGAASWTSLRDHVTGADLAAAVAGCEVVVAMRERTRFDAATFAALGDLRLLVTTGQHNAAIDLDAATAAGVTVCATGGRASANTAEMTWGLILALARHIPAEHAAMRAGGWQHTIGTDLAGATLGIVGLGRIGERVARIARAFEMEVLAWSQNLDPRHASSVGVTAVSKEELFSRSDVITVHLVLSSRSRGLIGAAELAAMKATAVLVNTSRGPIVDTDALVAALTEGRIGGAGLDVFDTEPLPSGHPLRHAPRTVITPHVGYVTRQVLTDWYSDVVDDIAAWQKGEPIRVLNG